MHTDSNIHNKAPPQSKHNYKQGLFRNQHAIDNTTMSPLA